MNEGTPQFDVFALCDVVRETAFGLHGYLGPGFLEKVYENGMAHRLGKQGLQVDTQLKLDVRDDDGTVLGEYIADMFVDHQLLVELKAVRAIADEHVAQLFGYLRACNVKHGLLINFGGRKLQLKKLVY